MNAANSIQRRLSDMSTRKIITAVLLGGFLLVGGTVPSYARNHRDKCEERIRKAEENLRKAERKHGEHSRQAENKRQELERARENCRMDRH